MQLRTALVTLCGLFSATLAAASTVLIDSQHNAYISTTSQQHQVVSSQQLGNVLAGLTGLHPAQDIRPKASKEVPALIKSSPLKKPAALLSLSVAGLTADDVKTLLPSRTQLHLESEEHTGEATTQTLAGLVQQNPDLALHQLEHYAAQACSDSVGCIEQLLEQTASVLGAQYDGQHLQLEGAALDMQRQEDKLLASELATISAGLQQVLTQVQGGQDIVLMDATLLGLQGVVKVHGADSAQAAAGKAAVQKLLQWAAQQLDTAFNGDYVMQVALFDAAPGDDAHHSVLQWKEQRTRRILAAATAAAAWPGDDAQQREAAKRFSAKAAGYGGFILMLYFILGGVYCLCYMPLKRDSLLYGSKKTD